MNLVTWFELGNDLSRESLFFGVEQQSKGTKRASDRDHDLGHV